MVKIDLLKTRPAVLLVVATFLCLAWLLPELIFHPNKVLLISEGDGLKSYYCFYFHTHFDDSLIHFSGMNYPHGEHYLFTDGFPVIAWLVQILPFLKPYGIAIIHLSLFFSLWLTPLFIYLILKKFKTETWIAFLGAFSLFILQPQFPRLFSHLSLAYSIFFPLSWYILIRYKEGLSKLKWLVLSLVNQLFWYFMHPYLGFMITLFYGLDWFFQQFQNVSWKKRLFDLIPVVTPVIFVQLLLKITDHITDRPENPFGFFEYQAHWKSIFLPPSGSLQRWMKSYTDFIEVSWEGQSYLGYLTILMLFVGFIMIIPHVLNRFRSFSAMHRTLFFSFIGASILLILSFGFPFNGNPKWLELVPFLKQFRALGRFSWPFYYVTGILSFVLLSKLYRSLSKKKKSTSHIAKVVISLLIGLQIVEAWNLLSIPTSFSSNSFQLTELTKEQQQLIQFSKKGKGKFKAILPLPWFHIGSETFGKEADTETLKNTLLLSAHTGIPIYAVMLGRTSTKQTLDYFHFFKDVNNKKYMKYYPYLVFQYSGSSLYAEDEQKIADQCTLGIKNSIGTLSYFSPEHRQKKLNATSRNILTEEFNDQEKWPGFIQQGRYRGLIENYNTILSVDSSQIEKNQWYEISFDYYPDWSKPLANVCYLEYVHPKTKKVVWFYNRSIGAYPGISTSKIQVNIRFKSQNFPCNYHCFLIGKSTNIFFEIDHLKLDKSMN